MGSKSIKLQKHTIFFCFLGFIGRVVSSMCTITITTSKNCGVCVCDHMPKKYLVIHAAATHEVAVWLFCNKRVLK